MNRHIFFISENECMTKVLANIIHIYISKMSMSSYWSQNNCFWVSSKHSVELMFACFFSPLENFLHVKGCEFWPMLETYGHWALSVLKLVSPTVWGPVTYTYCRAFHSGAVITWFYDLGLLRLEFEHQTFRMQSRLRHRRGLNRRRQYV